MLPRAFFNRISRSFDLKGAFIGSGKEVDSSFSSKWPLCLSRGGSLGAKKGSFPPSGKTGRKPFPPQLPFSF